MRSFWAFEAFLLTVVTPSRMDTPKYGETLKFMYIKYQTILGLPSLIMVKPEQFMKANHFQPALRASH